MGNSSTSLSNSNLDFSHNNNSRSNSYKRVTKPSYNISSINSNLDRSKFDALSRDTRSNTYHFGNTNGNMYTRAGDFQSYLNIYDDEDEDEVPNTFNNYNEGQNSNRSFSPQFMDSQQIKFANFNNENNENNEVRMKLDSIQDNRANTISKQYNAAKSSLDNMILNDYNTNANIINQASMDNMNTFDVNNYMRLSDGNVLSSLGFGNNEPSNNGSVPVKVEQFQDTTLSHMSANMNKKDTNNSNESISTTPVNKSTNEKKKKPKMSHNIIEQKYRDNINDKILQFKNIVPSLQMCCLREEYLKDYSTKEVEYGNTNNYLDGMVTDPKLLKRLDGLEPAKKLSKAIILSKSYEYIEHMEKKVEQLEERISRYERLLQADSMNTGRQSNFDGRIMQTPLSSLNQMKTNHTMSKTNSSGSYYMPDQIPKPPQDIKGPSHAVYQRNVNGGQSNMNTQGSAISSHSLSNSNDLSNSSMQSYNQFENYIDILGYDMKSNNSGANDNGSIVDFKRMQSPLANLENSNTNRRSNHNKPDINNYSYLEK
ncbi:hypothetical protein ACO0R3_000768 [Hanseniaspora guilliermondii]